MKRLVARLDSLTLLLTTLLGLGTWACSSDDDPQNVPGSGGDAGTGGATGGAGTGGETPSGGAASGGASGGTGSGGATGGSTGGNATGGTGGGSGGDPGSGGTGGTRTLEMPIMKSDSSYVLAFEETLFEVDPTQGARIVTFSHGGTNLLSMLEEIDDFLNGGSTLWTSPQTDWSWPPPSELDSDPYTVQLDGNTIQTSSMTATVGSNSISMQKAFNANLDDAGIEISYTLSNEGAAGANHSPWEVSRHARGGMTFWPGTAVEEGQWGFSPPLTDGVYWWDDAGVTEVDVKIFTDGSEGWVAHVSGDLLLVKVWTDSTQLAPGQGEIELYLGDGYIEIEEQGPYAEIPSSGSSTWDIAWYVRPIAPGVDTSAGSAELLAMARALAM